MVILTKPVPLASLTGLAYATETFYRVSALKKLVNPNCSDVYRAVHILTRGML
jgi:hypothetical protein